MRKTDALVASFLLVFGLYTTPLWNQIPGTQYIAQLTHSSSNPPPVIVSPELVYATVLESDAGLVDAALWGSSLLEAHADGRIFVITLPAVTAESISILERRGFHTISAKELMGQSAGHDSKKKLDSWVQVCRLYQGNTHQAAPCPLYRLFAPFIPGSKAVLFGDSRLLIPVNIDAIMTKSHKSKISYCLSSSSMLSGCDSRLFIIPASDDYTNRFSGLISADYEERDLGDSFPFDKEDVPKMEILPFQQQMIPAGNAIQRVSPGVQFIDSWSQKDRKFNIPLPQRNLCQQNDIDCHLRHIWANLDFKLPELHRDLQREQRMSDCRADIIPQFDDQYTVMMNAFDKEPSRRLLLFRHASHYANHTNCNQVILVWNNIRSIPPTTEELVSQFGPSANKITIKRQSFDTLNNRFRPFSFINTQAILIADDDIYISYEDIDNVFGIWKQTPDRMVGTFARDNRPKGDKYLYKEPKSGLYSMVLTKFMFIHQKYLHAYTCGMNENAIRYVDTHHNCEDITMNYLISSLTGAPPVVVETRPGDFGLVNGISSNFGHKNSRHVCLSDIEKFFPSPNPLFRVETMVTKFSEN